MKKVILFLLPFLLLCGCEQKEPDPVEEPPVVSADARKFKEEYESLNDKVRESDGATYNNVTIPEDNPIVYVNCEEALEILESEKAILYVGAEWCPWCRNAIPVLLEVAKVYNVDKIYYLNLDDEKSNYEIKDKKLVQTNKGSEAYYKLLDKLKKHLKDYVLTENNKKYDTKEKRIYNPTVISIKNKEVVSTHTGTVDLDKDQTKYSSLTEKQKNELYKIYDNMFKTVFDDSEACSDDGCD